MSSVLKHDETCNTTYLDNIILIFSNAMMTAIKFEANESIPDTAFLRHANFLNPVAAGILQLIFHPVLL
jgi:hypothetical protein